MKVHVVWLDVLGQEVDLEQLDGELTVEISAVETEGLAARDVRLAIETGCNRVEFAGKLALTDVRAGARDPQTP